MLKFAAALAAIMIAAPAALAGDECCSHKKYASGGETVVSTGSSTPVVLVSHHKEGSDHKEGSGKKAGSGVKAGPDIVDAAVANKDFSTLVAAVKAAGLVDALKGEGPFTVFAPTNEAFERLPDETIAALLKPEGKEQLTNILLYHVVPGKVLAKDVVNVSSADTLLSGKKVSVRVKGKNVYIDGARVVKTDLTVANGVIHVIDTVILPK